ncbi:MAG: SDR family oxidoreductase [Candidatus Brocadiae bacterium]|nr:SDR family oxidoreductase [Candidatus Brocadiia bacterium]
MLPEPRVYSADELKVGLTAEFERDITEDDVLTFARNSGDANPLHTDAAYAEGTNYRGRIVHGAFQVGLASAMAGMYLPGRNALLGTVNARFVAPLHYPCRVRVHGTVASWNAESRAGQLKVVVQDAGSGLPASEIAMGFSLHEERDIERATAAPQPAQPATEGAAPAAGQKVVLVTGAAGGLGTAIAAALCDDYFVLGLVHRRPLADEMLARPSVAQVVADVAAPFWEEKVEAALGEGTLYGVVHAAWPGAPHGGLLDVQDDVLERQLAFGTSATIRLARLLFSRAGEGGGRFVALSSIVASHKPVLALATYSLGKAALEHTVRLLAPELARRRVTINAVCPSFVPTGMHEQANELQRKREAALVPMGRLCEPGDVAGMVRYLLSPAASFVSGQVIGLTGAQL